MKSLLFFLTVIGIFIQCMPAVAESGLAQGYDEANFPTFKINDADFPDRAKALERMKQAFRDMLMMFRVACISHGVDDDLYDRYFEKEVAKGPETLLSVVCEAAGIEIADREKWDLQRCLKDEGPVSAKYKHWEIWAGNAESIPDSTRPELDQSITATTYHDISNLPGKGVDDAVTELYLRAFDFPKLADIKDFRGLNGLGNKDSGLMTTLGAQLVHEAFHWRYLCINIDGTNAEDFNSIVHHKVEFDDGQKDDRYYVDDYHRAEPKWHDDPELDPDDGYGPIHAQDLVENQQGDSYRNSDNYRWYIASLYWEEVFNVEFEELDNADWTDKVVLKGANGDVPFPGEKPPPTRFMGRFSRAG